MKRNAQRKHQDHHYGGGSSNFDEKKKRHRRPACEIDRHYKCPVDACQKSYGSEGSLSQHIKLKHGEYYAKNISTLTQVTKQANSTTKSEEQKGSPPAENYQSDKEASNNS
eukprot:TRINITY_DN2246_c0_g1_i15.p2 TRINITY_DN2246_c0_g1~~TRINITY_DN2246_c0_g1_i15.p2  ORF type:complete len:111 (-),score=25.27 TRINITY_DN2246_c0_g1_i15:282-614(-)